MSFNSSVRKVCTSLEFFNAALKLSEYDVQKQGLSLHVLVVLTQTNILFARAASFGCFISFLLGSISSFSRGKDSRGTKGGHWTERSEGSGWSDSGTPDSLFFAKQKATQRIKI